jgi:translation initiation factor 4A
MNSNNNFRHSYKGSTYGNSNSSNRYRTDNVNVENDTGSSQYYYNKNNRYDNSRYNNSSRGPEKIAQMQEQCNQKYDYASLAKDLLEKEDIVCSPEVFDMECKTFDDIGGEKGLKETLLQGIYAYGFEVPARIQSLAIPQIISGREILAQSQSGTGKTGAFVISALQLIDETIKAPQAIILSPTCDLAQQTYIVAKSLGSFMKDVNFSYTVGGADRFNNIKELGGTVGNKKNNEVSQIIIATPGRLKDLLVSNPELFEQIKLLIIDECDELLKGTFKEELKIIIKELPSEMKICLFSATLNTDVVTLADMILNNPIKILIKKEKMTLQGIKQTFVKINHPDEKIQFLIDMLASLPIQQFIVYVNSKKNAERLKEQLEKENYAVMTINSSNSKIDRAEIIRTFKKGGAKCLISTDLLARGIDIQQLSLVINYDLPRANNIEAYIHRIGRSGRFGKKGLAINLITEYDNDIQNLISLTFKCPILPLKEDFLKDI